MAKETPSASQLLSHKIIRAYLKYDYLWSHPANVVKIMAHNFIYGTPSYSQDRYNTSMLLRQKQSINQDRYGDNNTVKKKKLRMRCIKD